MRVLKKPLAYHQILPAGTGTSRACLAVPLRFPFDDFRPGLSRENHFFNAHMSCPYLPYLDFSVIAASGKRFWGYSDLTTIVNAVTTATGNESMLIRFEAAVRPQRAE